MKWMDELPSTPGHYWWKMYADRSGETEFGVVQIKVTPDGMPTCWSEENLGWFEAKDEFPDAQWYGPVEPPK